jgi:peptidoglycan/LPS O-acetylase OafA/YrhL
LALRVARGVIGKFLSLRVFVWLGEISFSIYMLHQVLLRTFTNLPKQYVSEWTLFGAIFALSVVSYVFIEKPGKAIIVGLRLRAGSTSRTQRRSLREW